MFQRNLTVFINSEDGGNIFLRNVGTYMHNVTFIFIYLTMLSGTYTMYRRGFRRSVNSEWVVDYLRQYPGICLKGLSKTIKTQHCEIWGSHSVIDEYSNVLRC
jgi:hypothetical protein